jgi:hypothetical protein
VRWKTISFDKTRAINSKGVQNGMIEGRKVLESTIISLFQGKTSGVVPSLDDAFSSPKLYGNFLETAEASYILQLLSQFFKVLCGTIEVSYKH